MCSTNTQRRRGDTETPTTSSTSTSNSNNGHNTINRDKTKATMEGEGGTNTTGKVARVRRNRMYHIQRSCSLSHTEVEYDLGGYSRGPRGTPWHCMSPTHFGTCCPLATAALLRAWMIFMYWLITWNVEHPQRRTAWEMERVLAHDAWVLVHRRCTTAVLTGTAQCRAADGCLVYLGAGCSVALLRCLRAMLMLMLMFTNFKLSNQGRVSELESNPSPRTDHQHHSKLCTYIAARDTHTCTLPCRNSHSRH